MSEIQASAESMKPLDGVHHTMRLPLHSGATEGSAYAESSSLSSSSSASPDSMRSLSSLSGGRTDSPLDLDMPDGIVGRKVTTGEDDSGIQSPDCRPENDNDNSTSIYLDADEQGWCEIRDDQDNVTLVLTHKQGQNEDCSDVNSNGNHGRRSSDDSFATEALLCCSGNEDEDEDDEEDSFLSLTSVDVVMKCQNEAEEDEMQSSTRKLSVNSVHKPQNESLQQSNEWSQMQSTSWRPDIGPMKELHQAPHQESVVSLTEKSQLQSSTRRSSVGHVSELYKEAKDSMKLYSEDDQLHSSTRRFSLGHISKLHQVDPQYSMRLHTKSPNVGQERTIQNEAPLELPRRSDKTSVCELNQEALQESVQLRTDLAQVQSLIRGPTLNAVDNPQGSVEPHPEDDEMQNSARSSKVDIVSKLQESVELHSEEDQMPSSSRTTNVDTVNELQDSEVEQVQVQSSSGRLDVGPVSNLGLEGLREFEEPQVEISLSQPLSEGETSIPLQEAQNTLLTSVAITETTCYTEENVQAKPASQNTKDCTGQSHTRPATKLSMSKSTKPELKRFPRPDLKNVKAKIISRTSCVPRPPNSNQSGSGTEKKPLPTRGRAANKKEQDTDGVIKKSRSSSSQTRAAIPAHAPDPKPKAIPSQTEKRPPPCTTPEVVVNRDQEESSCAEVMEVVKEEAESPNEEVTLVEQSGKEIPNDSDQKGSRVKPPKSTGGNVCVPTGVRAAAAPAGTPKTCGPTSSSSARGPQKPASKLPIKGGGLPTTLSSSSLGSSASENNTMTNNRGITQVMKIEEKAVRSPSSSQGKPAINKATVGIRNSTPVKPTSAGQKTLTQNNTTAAKPTHNALQRSASARPNRPPGSAVEKGSRGVRSVPGRPHGGGGGGVAHTEEEEEKNLRLQNERKNQCIAQLRKLVANGNRRLEALALVIQHIFTEREEALKQKKEVSVQLKNLREELTHSVSCCERLQKEKEEVCVALEAAVLKLQQQHQEELSQLEETLRDFYSAEWDKTHQAYQEEADKYRVLMQQQVEELKNKQEALRVEQQETHANEMKTLKQEYETTLTELRNSHKKDMQELDNTLKQSEAKMNEKLENVMSENEAMKAKLREEEERRKAFMEKGQKDPHLVYLEQELESLKVVLDIKTSKLHEQDKKIMQMDKLMESNVKLEECMKKLQQENEDYRARMDKHAALSRQLSSEQAMLQQTLQLESKVNKRLSMENEELLWKLHNGDLSSPRRLSPSSPFHSPRNSASFPSAPVSPR